MQVVRQFRRLPKSSSWNLLELERVDSLGNEIVAASPTTLLRRRYRSPFVYWNHAHVELDQQRIIFTPPKHSAMTPFCSASFSSETSTVTSDSDESVKGLYDKMLNSIMIQRTAPPNMWLWTLIKKCATQDDITHLFDILQRLRIFRLSNLRIHENFNCALCQEVTKTCIRVGAIVFGKKVLCKHNVYGLTPNTGSAHQLLLFAKQHNDSKLMIEIMKLLKRNDLSLQPRTADIAFSICYNTDNWDLMSKYGKRYVKAGIKLRQTSFDTWMKFAARIGDVDSLWKIEKIRSESMKQHTVVSGLSCAKGFLLENKPENAAALIQVLAQTLSDSKRPAIMTELQKLVSEWPMEVMKRQKDENKKVLAATLRNSIPAMLSGLSGIGVEVNASMEDLTREAGVLS